jgi:hypothetical protein
MNFKGIITCLLITWICKQPGCECAPLDTRDSTVTSTTDDVLAVLLTPNDRASQSESVTLAGMLPAAKAKTKLQMFPVRVRRSNCYPCQCKSSNLDCSDSYLTTVPRILNRFATTARFLDLSKNNIAELNNMFYYPSLSLIDLSQNQPFCEKTVCKETYPDIVRGFNNIGITIINDCVCEVFTQSGSTAVYLSDVTTTFTSVVTTDDTLTSVVTTDDVRDVTTSRTSTVSISKSSVVTKKTRPTPPRPPVIKPTETEAETEVSTETDVSPDPSTETDVSPDPTDSSSVSAIAIKIRSDSVSLTETQLIVISIIPSFIILILFIFIMLWNCCTCCMCCCTPCRDVKNKCKKTRVLIRETCCKTKKQKNSNIDLITANLQYLNLNESDASIELFSISDVSNVRQRRSTSLSPTPHRKPFFKRWWNRNSNNPKTVNSELKEEGPGEL